MEEKTPADSHREAQLEAIADEIEDAAVQEDSGERRHCAICNYEWRIDDSASGPDHGPDCPLKRLRTMLTAHPEAQQDEDDRIWRLLKDIQSWGNSVQFTCHERLERRLTQDDNWLQAVGTLIIAAADELLARRREGALSADPARREQALRKEIARLHRVVDEYDKAAMQTCIQAASIRKLASEVDRLTKEKEAPKTGDEKE